MKGKVVRKMLLGKLDNGGSLLQQFSRRSNGLGRTIPAKAGPYVEENRLDLGIISYRRFYHTYKNHRRKIVA